MDGDTKISTTVDFDASPVSPSGYITSSRIIPSLNKLSSFRGANVRMVTHLV